MTEEAKVTEIQCPFERARRFAIEPAQLICYERHVLNHHAQLGADEPLSLNAYTVERPIPFPAVACDPPVRENRALIVVGMIDRSDYVAVARQILKLRAVAGRVFPQAMTKQDHRESSARAGQRRLLEGLRLARRGQRCSRSPGY